MRRLLILFAVLSLFTIALPHPAHASMFEWAGTVDGNPVQGNVAFLVVSDLFSGYDLVITLTNSSTMFPPSTANVMTSLVFDVTLGATGSGLSLISADAPDGLLSASTNPQTIADPGSAGATICGPNESLNACAGTVQGGWEAAYSAAGFGGWANGAHFAIGTVSQGLFNSAHTGIPGQGETNYGVAPTAGINNQGGVYSEAPYAFGTATFTMSGLTSSNITISNVTVGYGTAPEGALAANAVETASTYGFSTPEPSSWVLAGGGVALLLARAGRRK